MGHVIMDASMSLDGFIADPDDNVGPLFDWYGNGDHPIEVPGKSYGFRVSAVSAAYVGPIWSSIGATVIGRHLFDITNGWGGETIVGDHVFVVTHKPPTKWEYAETAPFTFVTDGIESAIAQAQEVAGERHISLTAGNVGGQAMAAGLVDEVCVELIPVVFGSGVRYFGDFDAAQVLLDDPAIVQGDRVTHLRYQVRKP